MFAYYSDLYSRAQASCELSIQNEVVWEFKSIKYQPKLSYSKGIETNLCIIKHMQEEMPSDLSISSISLSKPLRVLKPKNVR